MFTRIIEISYMEQNTAVVAIWFLKRCPLILGLLCVFCSCEGTWISHQETSEVGLEVSRDGILHLRDCEIVTVLWIEHLLRQKRSSVWCFSTSNKSYYGWQDIISACLIDCQRTCELTSIIFSFFLVPNYHRADSF